ncbi:MAG: putative DNA binding domain-containing protein [Candidatus Omnitrophica bacterium]|nr:putative DNA binding domain-containing protein [Candidatus Omnitrophota bacterium]
MNLPININDLITARTVEWERLEFKSGWNPEDVLHTMCAFANDFHNLGGGYIVIGIGEQDGKASLPPAGLKSSQLDKIQKEIIELGHKIQPYYHPIVVPCEYKKRLILVLWCVGGQTRPYKAPVSLSRTNQRFAYYTRKATKTVIAKAQDEKELFSLAATVPFDDRINHTATLKDLDLGLIRSYLQQVKSDLFEESAKMDFVQLCRNMNIVDGPDEWARPKNVGLMFFNQCPYKIFPQTQIDIVYFPEGPGADSFSEKIFKGPMHKTLEEALTHIQSQVIVEKIIKHDDRPEADRFFNYSYIAIKEALCNAVYHRSYEIREPIEVRILPECITIGSFPGPDLSISDRDIHAFKLSSRRYRNRRVGELLKELDLTEGRGTGIPKILNGIRKNGSPRPVIHTDNDRTFFTVEFPVHPLFLKKEDSGAVSTTRAQSRAQSGAQSEQILRALIKVPLSMLEIVQALKLRSKTGALKRAVNELLFANHIEYTMPEKPNSRLQKYRLTEKGRKYIEPVR